VLRGAGLAARALLIASAGVALAGCVPSTPGLERRLADAGPLDGSRERSLALDQRGPDRAPPAPERAAGDPRPQVDAGPAPDCPGLHPLPLPFTLQPTPPRSEDFTFDNEGYLLLVSGGSLLRTSAAGPAMLLVPNVVPMPGTAPAARGLRMLAGGEVIIADSAANTLVRVEPSGSRRNLTTIGSPNGIVIGPGGVLYVSALHLGVYRVDPATGATTMVAKLPGADGLAFSLDYRTLYATNVLKGGLFRLQVNADGTLEPPELWVADVGREPDGMVTDACGNVYVTGFGDGGLRRVNPVGTVEVVAQFGDVQVPAVNFGSGRHGWAAGRLYVMNISAGGVFELDPGVGPPAPPP
jgi:streptogramin lyase